MAFVLYLLLLLFYLVSGYGVLSLFRLRLKTSYTITLSLLVGVAVASFVPFLMQLLFIPLTPAAIFLALLLAALVLNIPTILRIRREGFSVVRRSFAPKPFRVFPYEIPFLAIFVFFAAVSIWRCYYLPPTSRDALSGPEAIAEFAVREHTMINSFFSIDLSTTNNQFKSPYLISLQLIYKMAGFPFGQVWLSIVFVSFTIFLYHAMREKVHPILAGMLLLLFLMTPEMFAYTFMILYDYSNMIFFFLSCWFLFGYFRNKAPAWFYFSGLLMGIATYIRSETLVLALLFLPPILLSQLRDRVSAVRMVRACILFLLPSLLGYYLPGPLYIQHYLPVHYDVGGLINQHLSDWGPLFRRYSDMATHLIASEFGIRLWGYIFFLVAAMIVAEVFARDRYSKDARNWLYALLVLYIGLGALGFLLPLFDLNDTTKRGMFKLLPLAVLYLANSAWLIRLTKWISRWEGTPLIIGGSTGAPGPAVAAARNPVGRKPTAPAGKARPGAAKKRRNK
jgi:hypothetical protein